MFRRVLPNGEEIPVLSVFDLPTARGADALAVLLAGALRCSGLALPPDAGQDVSWSATTIASWKPNIDAALAPKALGERLRGLATFCDSKSPSLGDRVRRLATASDVFSELSPLLEREATSMEEELADSRAAGNTDWLHGFWSQREWEDRCAEALFREPLQASWSAPSSNDFDLLMATLSAFVKEVEQCIECRAGLRFMW